VFFFVWWLESSVILSLAVILVLPFFNRAKPWTYRVLLSLGMVSLVWTLLPTIGAFADGKLNGSPIMFLSTVLAFGILAVVDAVSDGAQRQDR
jgi:hypothetical protein